MHLEKAGILANPIFAAPLLSQPINQRPFLLFMKQFISALGNGLRQFPRTHLIIAMLLLAGVIITSLQPSTPDSNDALSRPLSLPSPDSETAQEEVASAPAIPWETLTVKSGDSLSSLLAPLSVGANQIHILLNSDEQLGRLTRIRPGETFNVHVQDGRLLAIQYKPSKTQTLSANWSGSQWHTELIEREYEKQTRYAHATITDSLFVAGNAAGISDRLVMQVAQIFGWDIDFVLDIRQGDRFQILYEELYLDGEKVGDGDILMAEFWNQDRHLTAFRYETLAGDTEYLNMKGDSMRKEFIRTPVAFARISSRFNLRRKHPVLNRIRAHKGIDYAAPRGTPIKAAGDGKVTFAGVKGGYGNVVIIQHGQRYTTLYAHLHKFGRGIRVGKRVKQGQTIGTVGSSGLATGPHLHYEFRVNGVHRNPLTVPLPKARGINDNERAEFLVSANRLKAQMLLLADSAQMAAAQ